MQVNVNCILYTKNFGHFLYKFTFYWTTDGLTDLPFCRLWAHLYTLGCRRSPRFSHLISQTSGFGGGGRKRPGLLLQY